MEQHKPRYPHSAKIIYLMRVFAVLSKLSRNTARSARILILYVNNFYMYNTCSSNSLSIVINVLSRN